MPKIGGLLLTLMLAAPPAWARSQAQDMPAPTSPAQTAAVPVSPAKPNEVRVLTPDFEGEDRLGSSVAGVLHLKLWRSLRTAPTPNPRKLNFGQGSIFGGPQLSDLQVETADAAVRQMDGQMILWGRASTYDGGVVVRSKLLAPDYAGARAKRPEIWSIGYGKRVVTLGLPEQVFAFAPFVLRQEIVDRYGHAGDLPLCPTMSEVCPGATPLGPNYHAIDHPNSKWSHVRTADERSGYVFLPELTADQIDVTDFTEGLIYYYRADYGRAAERFKTVQSAPSSPSQIRLDATVLRLMSLARSGADVTKDAAAALNEYPGSIEVRKAVAMADLQLSAQARRRGKPLDRLSSANAYVESARVWLRLLTTGSTRRRPCCRH